MLENKLELTSSSSELVREEERISKKRRWSYLKRLFWIVCRNISLLAGNSSLSFCGYLRSCR